MAMATPGPVRVVFWQATVFRRFWVSNLLASFVQPLLYLLGPRSWCRRAGRSHCSLDGGVRWRLVRRVHRAGPDDHHGDGGCVHREPVADPRRIHLEPRVLRDLGNPARPSRHRRRACAVDGAFAAWSPAPRSPRCWCCFPDARIWGLHSRRSRSRPSRGGLRHAADGVLHAHGSSTVAFAADAAVRRSSRCSCSAAPSIRSRSCRMAAGGHQGPAAVARRGAGQRLHPRTTSTARPHSRTSLCRCAGSWAERCWPTDTSDRRLYA